MFILLGRYCILKKFIRTIVISRLPSRGWFVIDHAFRTSTNLEFSNRFFYIIPVSTVLAVFFIEFILTNLSNLCLPINMTRNKSNAQRKLICQIIQTLHLIHHHKNNKKRDKQNFQKNNTGVRSRACHPKINRITRNMSSIRKPIHRISTHTHPLFLVPFYLILDHIRPLFGPQLQWLITTCLIILCNLSDLLYISRNMIG